MNLIDRNPVALPVATPNRLTAAALSPTSIDRGSKPIATRFKRIAKPATTFEAT